jgi:hypothetical protein
MQRLAIPALGALCAAAGCAKPSDPAPAKPAVAACGDLEHDTIGGVGIGFDGAAVRRALGDPTVSDGAQLEQFGVTTATWRWPSRGLAVSLMARSA